MSKITAFEIGKLYAPQAYNSHTPPLYPPARVIRRTPKQIVLGFPDSDFENERRKFEVIDGVEVVEVWNAYFSADMPEG